MSACHVRMHVKLHRVPPTGFLQELFADFVGSLEHALDAEDAWRSMMALKF